MHPSQQHTTIEKKYLIRETKELRVQVSELKEINEMHKNALQVLSQEHLPKSTVLPILIDLIRTRPASRRDVALLKRVRELQSQMMVMEKIADQASNSEKETYQMLAEEFHALKQDNMKKDNSLNKFYQKIGEVDYISGLVTKFVEVSTPSEQALAFQKEKQQLLDALNMLKQQVKKLSDEKERLVKINVHLKEELDHRKDQVRNMTMYINSSVIENGPNHNHIQNNEMILDELDNEKPTNISGISNGNGNHSLNLGNAHNFSMMNVSGMNNNSSLNNTMNFIRLQNELIKEEGGEQDSEFQDMQAIMDCPQLYHLFPDRVEKINSSRRRKKVPYLNMLKVRELMVKRENKIKKEMDQANINVNPTTKIIRLEGELEITRKQLTNLMLKHRTLSEDSKLMSSCVQEHQSRNQLLLEANERLAKFNQNLIQENQGHRVTIWRVQAVTGRKLLGANITEEELSQALRATTRRNTVNQLLENVLVTFIKPIRRSQSSFI